jgi:hypothetical protein
MRLKQHPTLCVETLFRLLPWTLSSVAQGSALYLVIRQGFMFPALRTRHPTWMPDRLPLALTDVISSPKMMRDVDSFEEWQEIRQELLWKYIKCVLPRDLLLVEQPRLPLPTCVEVMFRTVNTALLNLHRR